MLTVAQCNAFSCPSNKKFARLYDEGRLHLYALPTGHKYWRMSYKFNGVNKTYSMGVFKGITLSMARAERDRVKQLLAQNIDPNIEKQTKKYLKNQSYETFADCARNFIATHPEWSADRLKQVNSQLNGNILPYIGKRPIKEVKGTEILICIERMVTREAIQSAHKTLSLVSRIYETVALDGILDATIGIKSRLPKAIKGHYAAITDPKRFAELMRAIDGYGGSIEIKSALQIAPILFQRPKNIRSMRWREIDLENKLWVIRSADLKREEQEKITGEDHAVPLPIQAIEILERIKSVTGGGEFVFPNEKDQTRPFSPGAIGYVLTATGFIGEHTFHGFRASGRTIAAEALDIEERHLEAQMSHKIKGDALKGAYNRTKFIEQRRAVIQQWADYLDGIKAGTDIILFKARAS